MALNREVIVEVTNLSKKFGKTTVINDVSFNLKKGEIKGLLGPNGSGKTTILKMLVGLLKPTKGSILIEGINVQTDFEKAISKVGAIIENPEMYEYLTGYDNLWQYLRMAPNASEHRVDEVIELLGMQSYVHDKVETYSLGMLQRLGLAQALIHQPSILLLDEPTNGLDPAGIQDLRKHIKKLSNEGVSIIISSHLLAEIEMICDSVLIINNGQIVSDSELDDVRSVEESTYFFKLLNIEKLETLLSKHHLYQQVEKIVPNGFMIQAAEFEIAIVNKFLVENGFDVVGIEQVRTTLEDAFLARVRGDQ
ncbi:ABC transporter ATP-binding protein [Anaerobacillus alkaliphilus]|nr:ABC transporter ATP-binding protein [Anaerobacillus alkaliphilus]